MLGSGALVPHTYRLAFFLDVPADDNAVFVESVVNSPSGNLMPTAGLYFNPQDACDRMTVAIAVVKVLGLSRWLSP